MGEDQHAAGTGGLDEPERGDRLAGAGRVLEPEALVRVGVLGLLLELALVDPRRPASPGAPRPRARRSTALSSGSSSRRVVVARHLRSSSSAASRPRRRRRRRSASPSTAPGLVGAGCRWIPPAARCRRRLAAGRCRCRCRCAGRRPSAPSACPTARRPGGPRARCRRRGAVRPRTAVARGRAAARTPAAIRSTARAAGRDLFQRGVERAPAGGPGGQGLLDRFAFVDEAFARQQFGTRDRVRTWKRGCDTHDR